jgi:hypothetical protein
MVSRSLTTSLPEDTHTSLHIPNRCDLAVAVGINNLLAV